MEKQLKTAEAPAAVLERNSAPLTAAGTGKKGLCDIFREGLKQNENLKAQLEEQRETGVGFFSKWNESRLGLAFTSFDTSMKLALFEIIFLLNTNDKKYEQWKYQVYLDSAASSGQEGEKEINLYVEGAPCGVKGIDGLSPVFKEEFDTYIQETFGEPVALPSDQLEPAIEGIYSIGSIGTVGHKNIDSDLDLQVQYSLQPFSSDTSVWDDTFLFERLRENHIGLMHQVLNENGIDQDQVKSETKHKKAAGLAKQKLKSSFPILFQHFYEKNQKICSEIGRKNNQKLREQLVQEIINLMKQSARAPVNQDIEEKEALIKKRIEIVQKYANDKFPEAEIYLFSFSRQHLQEGFFGSTLDSKESSGGAYELILNYETLYPGIYFTPVIPSHFLFSPKINNDTKQFDHLNDLVRFRLLDGFEGIADNINFQGATPDLDPLYVAQHSAAAYWEAFKGSSGNLPKATLNLLRFEMLLEKKINKTNIQLVKDCSALDTIALPPETESQPATVRSNAVFPLTDLFFPVNQATRETNADSAMNFPVDKLLDFEDKHPGLKYDPWWLRYKSAKIGYGRAGLISNVPEQQLAGISNIIDLAFGLHIRVSDVFTKPGDRRDFSGHRETILLDYLATVFPDGSAQRNRLHAIFIGDVLTVNDFEKELRRIFQNSVERIHKKVNGFQLSDGGQTSKEEQIWYHFYKESFKSAPNVIQKSILSHLQTPRGRLQIGFNKKSGWVFRSLQKSGSMGKRFESSILNLLPDEITLTENPHFLGGLVYCVINGYYGIFNRGRLNETKTIVELDRQNIKLETQLDESRTFVRPDQIERIMKTILNLFPKYKVSYLDCIKEERVINEMMIFLNLLKYGQLSILYRDNLNTYYVDQLEIPSFRQNAGSHVTTYTKMLSAPELHHVIEAFLIKKTINIHGVNLATWVNINSVETTHAMTQHEAKEKSLAEEFRENILKRGE